MSRVSPAAQKDEKKVSAATAIQSLYRGHKVRQSNALNGMRHQEAERFQAIKKDEAAVVIQNAFKMFQARHVLDKKRADRDAKRQHEMAAERDAMSPSDIEIHVSM